MSKPMLPRESIAYMRELAAKLESLCKVSLTVGYMRGYFVVATTEIVIRPLCVSKDRKLIITVLQAMIKLQEVACLF